MVEGTTSPAVRQEDAEPAIMPRKRRLPARSRSLLSDDELPSARKRRIRRRSSSGNFVDSNTLTRCVFPRRFGDALFIMLFSENGEFGDISSRSSGDAKRSMEVDGDSDIEGYSAKGRVSFDEDKYDTDDSFMYAVMFCCV